MGSEFVFVFHSVYPILSHAVWNILTNVIHEYDS